MHDTQATWSAEADRVSAGPTAIHPTRSVGVADDVKWDLEWTLGMTLVSPLRGLMARIEPFDMSIVVWPQARFTGFVQVGSERFEVTDIPGTFYHYWGRRLLERWVWLSATLSRISRSAASRGSWEVALACSAVYRTRYPP